MVIYRNLIFAYRHARAVIGHDWDTAVGIALVILLQAMLLYSPDLLMGPVKTSTTMVQFVRTIYGQ